MFYRRRLVNARMVSGVVLTVECFDRMKWKLCFHFFNFTYLFILDYLSPTFCYIFQKSALYSRHCYISAPGLSDILTVCLTVERLRPVQFVPFHRLLLSHRTASPAEELEGELDHCVRFSAWCPDGAPTESVAAALPVNWVFCRHFLRCDKFVLLCRGSMEIVLRLFFLWFWWFMLRNWRVEYFYIFSGSFLKSPR